jgi:myo-inositol-1(or 4)-monophosphatase
VMHQNKSIAGVIFEPATENMYTAAVNTDTQLNSSRIQASDDDISKVKSVALDSHFADEQLPPILELIRSTRYRNLGTTAMHLAYVAKGSFIGAVVKNIKLWELAACSIILENAGAVITDYQGKSLFPINPAEYKGEGFAALAGNKRVHPKLLEMFNKSIK